MAATRCRFALLFLLSIAAALWRADDPAQAVDQADQRRYERARGVLRTLLDRHPQSLGSGTRERLAAPLQQLQAATANWGPRSIPGAEAAMMRILALLDHSAAVERITLTSAGPEPPRLAPRRLFSGEGALIVRIARPGPEDDSVPDFVLVESDLSANPAGIDIECGSARTVYAVVLLENAVPGLRRLTLQLRSQKDLVAALPLAVEVPKSGRLEVALLDAGMGQPTPAVAGLYSSDGQLVIPSQALSFSQGGFQYPVSSSRQALMKSRPYEQAHYWPASSSARRVFFVDGRFALDLPEGDYTVIAGKGFEYTPVTRAIRVHAGATTAESIALERWIDMPARGWYSGDGHVHFARPSPEANRDLMLWTQAEDVHMANVVRMGDALETYFEQYAFGEAGRHRSGGYALVAGQEDPRTSSMGHTLHLNLQAPVRNPEQYYLYDLVFDETRRQGALTGYAHAYQPASMGFFVRQDMTMNVAAGRIDFAEISEFGDIDSKLYYEFLNLGFPLTASAGSDVPWGNTIGTSRVYAWLDGPFDPDAWFRAVKNGQTFVTTGPMLELRVNGALPGARLEARPGDKLRIQARAQGRPVLPRYLEVVSQGEVVRAAQAPADSGELSLEFTLPVTGSTWIAARSAGAHTSPVYVQVNGGRFWKRDKVDELIDIRLRQLADIEQLMKTGTFVGSQGGWNNPEGLQKQIPMLTQRVEAARAFYVDLRQQARRERDRAVVR